MIFCLIAVVLRIIVVHSPGGGEIDINPNGIVSMRSEYRKGEDRMFTENTNCMINTSDGRFISVVESCAEVRKLIEELER